MMIITGSSGFLSRIICQYIDEEYITLGRSNATITCNLAHTIPRIPCVDLVIHAAGKAHAVPKTQAQVKEFFDVNVNGTKNLLKGLEEAPRLPQYFVFISSVSVYGLDTGHSISEDAPLLAQDPYGKSKIEAENIVKEWCRKQNIICTVLRLPLLAGPTPPGNLGAMIKGISKGYYFNIGGGKAKKSMVLAEDVAKIIPVVAKVGGTYNLTDRCHPSFHELSSNIAKQLHRSQPASIPMVIAKTMAIVGNFLGKKAPINSEKFRKIVSDLTFDDSKAVETLGWKPTPVLQGLKIH